MPKKSPQIALSEKPAIQMWHQLGYTATARAHAAARRNALYGSRSSFASDEEKPEPPLYTALGASVRDALKCTPA